MKDRLIELLDGFVLECVNNCPKIIEGTRKCHKCAYGKIADYLIANGVIVLPCKVGDKLHKIHTMYTPFISELKVENYGIPFKDVLGHWGIIPFEEIGKTVFLTREEAEKALRKDEGK